MLIFLIGFMGCGKTTAGKKLAKLMNYEFVDTDSLIEKRFNKTINQIFDEYGELEFRNSERVILDEVLKSNNCIISTGGGLPCYNNNMELMNKHGLTVFFQMSPNMLTSRLSQKPEKRPLLKHLKSKSEIHKFIINLLDSRASIYLQSKIIYNIESESLELLVKRINKYLVS